jgi:predicted PurR-regulated permease PerM
MIDKRLRRITYGTVLTIAIFWVLYIGSSLILPMVFAILFAILLNPICDFIQRFLKFDWLSIIVSFIIVTIPIIAIISIFSFQFINIVDTLPSIEEKLVKGFNVLIENLNNWSPLFQINTEKIFESGLESNLVGPFTALGKGLINSSSILVSYGLFLIYSFFLLLYKNKFKAFITAQMNKNKKYKFNKIFADISDMVKAYVSGLSLVIVLLIVINCIGLYLIGIEFALFWGTLAGLLAVIPFIGTIIGGLLPFIYSLATTDTYWQPLLIVVFYIVVQQIEGNLITPKIVGDKVDINPLFAILALVFFGTFWGIGGVFLALPLISIIRIVFNRFKSTTAIAELMATEE